MLVAIVTVVILACLNVINIPFLSSISKPQKEEVPVSVDNSANNKKLDNGDITYHPDIEEISFDEENSIVFFNDVLVVYTFSDLSNEQATQLAESVDGEVVGDISGAINALQIKVDESTLDELNEKANILMSDNNVLYAGYDYPIQLSSSTDGNPWSDNQNNPIQDKGNEDSPGGNDWWAEAIGAYTAWEGADNLSPIKVGVLDSGFDADHQDLSDSISFLPNYSDNTEAEHGTHVAGLISANNNDIGIRGVADNAELICVDWSPVTNNGEDGNYVNYLSTGEYMEIIKQLIENDVRVINNSWGNHVSSKEGFTQNLYGESNDLIFLLEYFAVDATGAYDSYLKYIDALANRTGMESMLILIELFLNGEEDFLILQAAGNGYDNGGKGYDTKRAGFFCSIDEGLFNILSESTKENLAEKGITYNKIDEHILIVGAVKNERDANGNYVMTSFSNWGDNVDICAPGQDIYSTVENNGYKSLPGTSMACPIVAGSAALLWSTDLEMSAEEVRGILISNATVEAVGVGDGKGKSYPFVNVGEAISSEKKFYTYINKNLTVSTAFPSDYENEAGVFSALVEDFDNNGKKEMLTFSIKHNVANQAFIVLDLYVIKNNIVTHVDTSKDIYASGAGNYQIDVCGTFVDSLIKIQYSSCSLGGSSFGSNYMTYKVENDSLILCNEFSLYEFYRYESYTYEETVSGKTFSSSEDFHSAVDNSGYDRNGHSHVGWSNSEFDINQDNYMTADCFKGNHIFTLVDSRFMLGPEVYGFIHDNTKLSEKLAKYN